METMLYLITQSLFSIIDLLTKIELKFLDNFLILKTDFPIIIEILNYMVENLVILLRCFNAIFTLRFMLAWFPNVNPFIAPYYAVRVATQPFIDFIGKRLPKIFGQDVSFFVCSFILTYALENLPKLRF
jgi:uncharacterized protein YggT (Ycf19 family)